MIRREASGPDGRLVWLLISQIEHARLAGALAADWGAAPYEPLPARDELLPAIIRHDDGWAEWERCPDVDPQTGRPRDFLEMPVDQTLVIWRTSIERAAAMSPLGGYAVAGHFRGLIEHAEIWGQHGSRRAAAAHQWSADIAEHQQAWLKEWCHTAPQSHTPAVAQSATAWLQFFDRLSLWLSMRTQREPAELATPQGPPLRLTPQGDRTITVAPWPLNIPEAHVSLSVRSVPQRHYASAADLASERGTLSELRLRLVPAS
ncbi:MAG: DUF3891 family protein [Planctomycetia bacterium]|nr:DUF3891 family protein [Planctomycetia bacterium]